jgi:hypothetical protein
MQTLKLAQHSATQVTLTHTLLSLDQESGPEDARRLEMPLHVLTLEAMLVVTVIIHGFFERSGLSLSWNCFVDSSGDIQ